MKRNKRIGILALAAIGLAAVVGGGLLRPRPLEGVVTFGGWTNVAGRTYAMVHPEPRTSSRAYKWISIYEYYRVNADFVYVTNNGQTNAGTFLTNIGFSHPVTRIEVNLPPGASGVRLVNIDSWLERSWSSAWLRSNVGSPHDLLNRAAMRRIRG